MKKLISILLAVLMMFSFVTVAFADEPVTEAPETTVAPETPEAPEDTESVIPDLGEYNWILDLPFWTVGPALKFAKIALKLVSVYLKVAKIFGLVEEDMGDMIMGAIIDMIKDAQNAETQEETTAPVETTEAIA